MSRQIQQSSPVDPDPLSKAAVSVASQILGRPHRYLALLAGAVALASFPSLLTSGFFTAPSGVRLGSLLVGLVFVSSGLAGLSHRPDSPAGTLLVLAGYLYLLGRMQGMDPAIVALIAFVANVAWQSIVFYIVFSFPHQRLRTRGARAIVVSAVVYTVANNLFVLVTAPTRPTTGSSEANPFYVEMNRAVLDTLREVLLWGGGILITVSTAWLARRWLAASPPLRRSLTPIYLATFVVSTVALVLRFVVGVVAPTTDPGRVVSVGLLVAFGLVPIAFLIGLLRSRIARSAVADLVVQLAEIPSTDGLRDALAKALGDPDLELIWLSESSADASSLEVWDVGSQVADSERVMTLIETHQGPGLAILHDPSLLDEPDLVDAVATAVRLAMENELLASRVKSQLEEVQASRARIAAAADEARSRIERDIHDGTQQQLVAATMALQATRVRLDGDDDALAELDAVAAQLADALDELRELARGIHPAVLTQRGLRSALGALARRSPVPVRLELSLQSERFPQSVESAAYFICSEALTNAQRHADASEVVMRVQEGNGVLIVSLTDDGSGGAALDGGSGLAGMRDRAETIGGTLQVVSPVGGPTVVTAELPIA